MNPTEIQTCTNGAWGTAVSCVRQYIFNMKYATRIEIAKCLEGCAARTINNGAIVYNPANTTNNVYQSGADATYTCATGYYLSSLEDVTIQICSGGSWGATLSCIGIIH